LIHERSRSRPARSHPTVRQDAARHARGRDGHQQDDHGRSRRPDRPAGVARRADPQGDARDHRAPAAHGLAEPPDTLGPSRGRIPTNIADHIGNTPMVRLSRLEPEGVELYGKLEAYNPGGSVKDRIGIAMIEAAEAEGRIEPGRTTIVEATSGNTGIA